MKRIAFFALATLLTVACQRELVEEKEVLEPLGEPEFYAMMEAPGNPGADTKVYADENMKVLWNSGDRVSIFNKSTLYREYEFTGKDGDNAGGFKCVYKGDYEGTDLDAIYAVYPSGAGIADDGVMYVTLPNWQMYKEHSFGIGANTMVSVGTNNVLRFKNVGGYLAFKLYGENLSVSRIRLEGRNHEKLSGGAYISMEAGGLPTVTWDEYSWDSSESVTLACETPVPLGSSEEDCTEFWLVLPPTDFTQGFTLTVFTSNGGVFTKSISSDFVVERNSLMRMAALEVVPESLETPPDNEIWYISTSGKADDNTPKNIVAGANLVSHTYENGKGILKFDAAVTNLNRLWMTSDKLLMVSLPQSLTTLNGGVFYSCSNLSSIRLPENLTTIWDRAFSWCISLTSITLPESLETIGESILYHCPALESIQGKWASADGRCLVKDGELLGFATAGLTSYSLPEGIVHITPNVFCGYWTGAGYVGLESLTLPASLQSVAPEAFEDCLSLSAFYGQWASEDNRCLVIDKTLVAYAPNGLAGDTYTIPEGVEAIQERSFLNAWLSGIVLPTSLKTIGALAFAGQPLRHLVIPASVTQIGDQAFYNCSHLESITVEAIVPPVLEVTIAVLGARRVFDTDCPIYVPVRSLTAYLQDSSWSVFADRIQAIPGSGQESNDVILYTSTDGSVVVPYDVQAFDANIVSNTYQNGVGTLQFDKELTTIQAKAFKGCQTLASIFLPDSATLEGDPFFQCTNLKGIFGLNASNDGRLWIQDHVVWAFAPAGLSKYTLPEGITALQGGFEGLSELESLTLPASLGRIKALSSSSLQELKVFALAPPVVEYSLQLANLQVLYVPFEAAEAYSLADYWSQYADRMQGAYRLTIQIDGDFSDWDALDNNIVSTAQCAANAQRDALKKVKVCADEEYVYVYFEWDPDMISHEPDVEHVPFQCLLNTDGNTSTGGFSDWFSDACTDVLLEGDIYPDGAEIGSYDPGAFSWVGEPNGSGWMWEDLGAENLCQGAGVEGKYELWIDRAAMAALGFPIADVFSIGFDIQQYWDPVGILPNANPTDDNPSGSAPSLWVQTH